MLLSLLHLPPLPVTVNLVERDDNTVINDQHTETSHAIICNLIEWMAAMDVQSINNKRMGQQMGLQASFQSELRSLDLNASDETLYGFFCHHTRLWLNSYTEQGNTIRFKPIDSVSPGDRVHTALLDYAKAQYHHFKQGEETLDIDSKLPFIKILRKCAEWSKEWNADNAPMQTQNVFVNQEPTDEESEPDTQAEEVD
jgi:hypothetical protein